MDRWGEVYQLYMQGLSYQEIQDLVGLNFTHPHNASQKVKAYAKKHGLPFPRQNPDEYIYSLYINGMSLKDLARFFQVTIKTVWLSVTKHAQFMGVGNPFRKYEKPMLAYQLRMDKKLPYKEIARLVGYKQVNSCIRAVSSYKKKWNLP